MTSDRSGYSSDAFGSTYAYFQLAKALVTAESHLDADTRSRAKDRADRWVRVFEHALRGTAGYGSRAPFAEVPAWATLEVVTGGFATGRLLAGGELTTYERELSSKVGASRGDRERQDLNLWHLTDAGLDHLQRLLADGCYRIELPEEAALLTVAWLVGNDRAEQAWSIIEAIAPFFDRLRFYPESTDFAPPLSAEVSIFTVGDAQRRLSELGEQPRLAAQKHAIEVRLPLYDAAISLFLETYADRWPCRHYPEHWFESAKSLVTQIKAVQGDTLSSLERRQDRVGELFALMSACARDPASLNGRHVGRIRRIVDDHVTAHGRPDSPQHIARRQRQRFDVEAPAHCSIGQAVAARLGAYPAGEGLADFSALSVPITEQEATSFSLKPGQSLPESIRVRLERCRRGTIVELIEHGIITSSDTIARVLPVLAAEIRSSELIDPSLRRLYAATYRAFRRRRSLLLLNLESQVRLNELPWVAAVDGDRAPDASTIEAARTALIESASVAIAAFPHALTPNKLVREFRALASSAQLDLPFVDEIAADIFMGEFTNTFIDAARRAAGVVARTLYANYFDIDTGALASLPDRPKTDETSSWWSRRERSADALAALAAERAGVSLGGWSPAINGTILEQSQILTTHNLAVLFNDLGLRKLSAHGLDAAALSCFQWICRRQQMRIAHWHSRLIMVKNTAYAWRQMIFYLSMLEVGRRDATMERIEASFCQQPEAFRSRFDPAMRGLRLAAAGERLPQREEGLNGARVFLGWTTGKHWLLA